MTEAEKTISSHKDLNVHGSTIAIDPIEEKLESLTAENAIGDNKAETMDRGELQNILHNHNNDESHHGRNMENYDTGRPELLP